MKKKKPTAWERIMCDFYDMTLDEIRNGESHEAWSARTTAASIDAAIRRGERKAVKDALHPSVDADREYRLIDRKRVAAKYGVRLKGNP